MTPRRPVLLASALLFGAALALAACAPAARERPADAEPSPAASTPPPSDAAEDASAEADVLAERDAFFAQQGRPQEGALPTPQTPAQEEFLAQQRAYVQSQGGSWDEFYDGVALAVTLDACETSILNAHAVTTETAQAHIASSPLIAQIAGGDPAATQGLASIMVFGTGFVCPEDAPQWEAAYAALYG